MGCGFFNRPLAFGFCYTLLLVFQVSVGIYIGGILTTLERQYRIKSSVSGLVVSTSDFASLVSIVGVTYVGKSWHRPRIVGVCAILTGLGGILSGLPHFLYPAYRDAPHQPTSSDTTLNMTSGGSSVFVCDFNREEEVCTDEQIDESGSRIDEMWAMFLGQALMGLAYGPLFPIAVTYLDDQVKGTTTPYYIAVFLTAAASSTIVGFGQAFVFLTTNVNWPAAPDYSKEWLGAWWLGFIVDGVIILFIAIPFFFFPKKMDVDINEDDIPKERLAAEQDGQSDIKLGVKDFVQSSKRIGKNTVFMALLVSTIFELAVSASFGFFMAKFLEIRYNTAPSFSALLVGIIVMPGALIGNVSSGIIVKKLKLTSRGCARMIVGLNVVVLCCLPVVYFLSCPEPNYAGYAKAEGILSVYTPCNNDCMCTTDRYEPVCGQDGMVYATPCLAGCTGQRPQPTADPMVNATVYTGCICSAANISDLSPAEAEEAVPGKCLQPCNAIYFVGILLFCIVLFGSMVQSPLIIFEMRSVGNDKTFALGIAAFFSRAFGFLPAPIYFGAAIERACALERTECDITGDCLVYSAQRFTITFLGIYFGLKICNLIFYGLAMLLEMRKRRNSGNEEDMKDDFSRDVEGKYNQGYIAGMEIGTQTNHTEF